MTEPSTGSSVLVIDALDPEGSGTLSLKLRVLQTMGIGAHPVATCISWRAGVGERIAKLPRTVVTGPIDSVARNAGACVVGWLPSPELVNAVMDRLRRRNVPNIVLQPVLATPDGVELLHPRGIERLRGYLSRAACVVLDLSTARTLLPAGARETEDPAEAARILVERGTSTVIIQATDPARLDMMYGGDRILEWPALMPASSGALAAAIAGGLAQGNDLASACESAVSFLRHWPERAQE